MRPVTRRAALAAVAACTALKIVIAASFVGTADVRQTRQQAEAFVAGRDVLEPHNTGNNPSFFLAGHYALAAGAYGLAAMTGLEFSFLIKLPAIFADAVVAWLLLDVERAGPRASLAFVLNPLTFLLSAYHGQLHTVAAACAVAGLCLAARGREASAGTALGLSTLVRQHFALLLLPVALAAPPARRGRLVGAFAVLVVGLNLGLVASASPTRVLAPTWVFGAWGYGLLLVQGPRLLSRLGLPVPAPPFEALAGVLQRHGSWIFLGWAVVFAAWCLRTGRRTGSVDPWRGGLVFLAGVCAVGPGFGVQWLAWSVPFWLVVDLPSGRLHTWLAGAFVAGSYWQWTLPARHHVTSITAQLPLLSPGEMAGVATVGLLGLLTWLQLGWTAVRFARRPSGPAP